MRVSNNKLLLDDQMNEKPAATTNDLDLYLLRGIGQIQEEEKLNTLFIPMEGKKKKKFVAKIM